MKPDKATTQFLFTTALLFQVIACSFAQQENRVALVIGVQNYVSVPPLRHSLNDATDMASALKLKGFKVETLLNPKSKKEIKDAIARYYNVMRAQSGAVGIVYYAGHGIQFEGENYLIPTTANLQVPGDMEEQCVKMNTVMSVLNSSGTNLNILLLDACRTNAFPSFSRDIVKGLSNVEAPKGSIVVFATQPGTVASDGTGKNGLFTSKLLKYINEPNLNIGEVLKKVKQDVNNESAGVQLPSVVDNSTGGDFYFTKLGPGTQTQSGSSLTSIQLFENGKKEYDQKNFSEAYQWFIKAAELGNPGAQLHLGRMFSYGQGVKRDHISSLYWYRLAAEQGPDGKYCLGIMYRYGIAGTPVDLVEAGKLYDKAAAQYRIEAEKGNATSQVSLGNMYSEGGGSLKMDDQEAIKWYRKAADQGNADAQFYIGRKYQDGLGVLKDESEAIKWFTLAADQGNNFAREALDKIGKK